MFIEAVYAAEEAANTTGVLGSFGVDWRLLSAQLLNFAILLFVLHRWVYKPLLGVLDARRETIETGLKQAKEAEATLASADALKNELLASARTEALTIIATSKKAGDEEKERRLQASNDIIESRLKEAKEHIIREQRASEKAVIGHIAGLIATATEKVAHTGLKDSQQHALIEEALQELSSSKV